MKPVAAFREAESYHISDVCLLVKNTTGTRIPGPGHTQRYIMPSIHMLAYPNSQHTSRARKSSRSPSKILKSPLVDLGHRTLPVPASNKEENG